MFSFFLSAMVPMVSHPLAGSPKTVFAVRGGPSVSLKIASFCLPPRDVDDPPMPEEDRGAWGSAGRGVDTAKGSIFATKAGRTVGKAGDEGSSPFWTRDSNLC